VVVVSAASERGVAEASEEPPPPPHIVYRLGTKSLQGAVRRPDVWHYLEQGWLGFEKSSAVLSFGDVPVQVVSQMAALAQGSQSVVCYLVVVAVVVEVSNG
jgi:hypothetical protein